MPTDEQVRAAREENEKLRLQIEEKQAENAKQVEAANNEYRMQRYAREREQLEAQLAALDQSPVAIPQVFDEAQVYADTVQPDAVPEVVKNTPKAPKPSTDVPSTPTDVATINPQGE